MTSEANALLQERNAGFDQFYAELMPVLVDFVEKLGIKPPHEVLRAAVQFVSPLDHALKDMVVASAEDRTWLLTRMAYFIGEYFVQKYGGCWSVSEAQGSKFFARCVVGQFVRLGTAAVLDPFEVAKDFVDAPAPRHLEQLLKEVGAQLTGKR